MSRPSPIADRVRHTFDRHTFDRRALRPPRARPGDPHRAPLRVSEWLSWSAAIALYLATSAGCFWLVARALNG